jgi:NAD(P)-dependent dehydrogenase (short-subunit alcohol dehydrogenase family)
MLIGDVGSLFRLDGKSTLVTGAAQGLGRAIAEGFAQYGADVALIDINANALAEAAEGIRLTGKKAIAIECDVADQHYVQQAVEQAIFAFGKIDVLAAVAGIGDRNPAEKMTIEQWERVIAINLRGVWLFDQEVGKQMIARGAGGSIINMASIAGQVGLTTGNANYSASKGGVIALTRDLAIEWAQYKIRVNALAPAQFKTPLIANLLAQRPEVLDYFIANIPLGRIGELEEIVGPAVFLASDAAAMVTGVVLNVDGGHTAR